MKKTEEQQSLEVVTPAPPAPLSTIEIFASLARDPSIPVDRIKQLMDLQAEAERRDAEKQFIAAMNRLQPRLPRIAKKGAINFESKRTGSSQNTPYATYEDIDEKVRPLMHQEGFSVTYGTRPYDKGLMITATLSHIAGHSKTEEMPLPLDTSGSKNAIQAVGSTMSYGKRYLLCAMLNIVAIGEDDDAQSSDYISDHQINSIVDMQTACQMDAMSRSKFLDTMKSKAIHEIRKRDYEAAMNLLQAKYRQVHGKESSQ